MIIAILQHRGQLDAQIVELTAVSSPFVTWLVFGLAAFLIGSTVFAGLSVFVLIFRRQRMMVELISFWLLLNEILRPAEYLRDQFNLPDSATGIIYLVLILTFISITYGTVLDGLRFGLDWKSKRRVRIRRPIEEVWPTFALLEGGAASNWQAILHDAQPVPGEANSFDVSYLMGPSVFQKQRQTVLESDAPSRYHYSFSGNTHSKNRRLTEGEFDVTLEPDGKGGTLVTVYQHQKAMLPRIAMLHWFDDQLGDALDGFAARMRGRHHWSMTGLEHRKILSLA